MKMKKIVMLVFFIGILPLSMMAQDDDMYFVSKKKTASTSSKEPTYYVGSDRNVDEYNRRGGLRSSYKKIGTDAAGNDIIEFDSKPGLYPDTSYVDTLFLSSKKKYIDENDYKYSRYMSRWDGYYGWYDPWYYGHWGYGPYWRSRYYWYDPWYSSYYGWYSSYYGWYDPWYYNYWGWYDPWYYSYWGWYYPGYSSYWWPGGYAYHTDYGYPGGGGSSHRGSLSY
jgi:hypothetical protein